MPNPSGRFPPQAPTTLPVAPRRGFFRAFAAGAIGALLAVFPFLTGLVVFFDPLRRRAGGTDMVFVAPLANVPDDGVPRQFQVIVPRRDDAWTRHLNEPVGAVYLVRKQGQKTVLALQATCPHAGCFIAYAAQRKLFACPCHRSEFAVDGARTDAATSPSPRDMDSLECEVRDTAKAGGLASQEVWVKFQNFHIATSHKIARA